MALAAMRRADLSALLRKSREDREQMWKCFELLSPELVQEIFGYVMIESYQPVDASNTTALFDRIYRKVDSIPSCLADIAVNVYFEVNTFNLFTTQPLMDAAIDPSIDMSNEWFFDLHFPAPFSRIRRIELCCLTVKEENELRYSSGPTEQNIVLARIEQRLSLVVERLRAFKSLIVFLCPVKAHEDASQGTRHSYTHLRNHLALESAARIVSILRALKVSEVALGFHGHIGQVSMPWKMNGIAMTEMELAKALRRLPRQRTILVKGTEKGYQESSARRSA
ncbi:hypothetical protein CB0940_08021 [Cercospora beticola]|uniref:Uncharacterized protein n=1 Tax=Cercospora beticola TaxID=122368 RepID=A0A2G5HNS6_CERBT|nr:hypothetical protein CB0940_08021 [Cercospora beticola]PIA94199.1 hypothetical protein CB0940_08021 [Cercospora beticola]WPB04577.1 hypothetical protein RHO25_009223 [Cercospora beticola]